MEEMRAAYYEAVGGPGNVQIGERPGPTPDADHTLVRTHAAGWVASLPVMARIDAPGAG